MMVLLRSLSQIILIAPVFLLPRSPLSITHYIFHLKIKSPVKRYNATICEISYYYMNEIM